MDIPELLKEIKVAALAALGLLIILCGLYPLVVWSIAQAAFPDQANGSLAKVNGQIVGSALLAQNFTGVQYFHPRPSAAGDTGYDGNSSSGSNLGPLSQKLTDQVKTRVENYRQENNLPAATLVPADADRLGMRPGPPYQPAKCRSPGRPGGAGQKDEREPDQEPDPEVYRRP